MYKENGRDKKPEDKEFARSLKRSFKCSRCNEVASFKSIQFGEVITCPVCGEVMYEKIKD